jgi:ABC-type branched-subunit amino acid transport system permease subunit
MIAMDKTVVVVTLALAGLLLGALVFPAWLTFLLTVALAKGLVVLGLLLLMRSGLVSFGHGLYYCLGAYVAGTLSHQLQRHDGLLMVAAALVACVVLASILGLLLASYRSIFFAMLSLAFSMILYGLLVKTSALGSTDGFNVRFTALAGLPLSEGTEQTLAFALAAVLAAASVLGLHRYLRGHGGRLATAIRDNELRVEYMGASVRRIVHLNYVLAAGLAGIGGALTALTVGHVDPEMAYWTTSGEFVFVAILAGTGSLLAPFLGSILFEGLRSFAYEYSPNTWQLVLGVAMLLVIVFLPNGVWSVFSLRRKAPVKGAL